MSGDRQRVVVVTGGGGGIGAAIAEELGRAGTFVVTMDPLVSVDGTEQLPPPEETTAGRIVAAGGSARASSVSVTDGDAVRALFDELVAEHGGLDGVVNVAGISRPTGFATGDEEDWRSVLSVHLDGYLNILRAALPIMATAGHGRVLGVTSGSGWRPANTGAYGCAKRAVAALTWELGRCAPPGVVVNAVSPIAMTRMVTAALGHARPPQGGGGSGGSATGGLSLGSMPAPEQLGPLGAHLVDDELSWCTGQVVFAAGSELALVEEPRLLEVVRTEGAISPAHLLEAVTARALLPAEAGQVSTGGSNPRFGPIFDEPEGELPPAVIQTCAVVTDAADVGAALTTALEARGVRGTVVKAGDVARGFQGAAAALGSATQALGSLDAVVVALAGGEASGQASEWERVLAEHDGLVEQIHADAGWARAVADHAAQSDRPVRIAVLTDATTAGGRSRAQAAAQHARSAQSATDDRVSAFPVSVEVPWARGAQSVAELATHLLCSADTVALSGAELVAGPGWCGLRRHPRASGSITYGGPEIPEWLGPALRGIAGEIARR